MYSYRERYPAATLSTSRLETTSTDDDHNISRLHNAHASRTLIIRSCATHLHTVMYWRRHRNDGRGGRWSQLLSNENTVQVVWQHAWPALTPAAVTSQTNTPPASQLDKNGQSIKCCPRERHRWMFTCTHDTDWTATCSEAWLVPRNSGNERSAIVHCTDARLASPRSAELREHQTCHNANCIAALQSTKTVKHEKMAQNITIICHIVDNYHYCCCHCPNDADDKYYYYYYHHHHHFIAIIQDIGNLQ